MLFSSAIFGAGLRGIACTTKLPPSRSIISALWPRFGRGAPSFDFPLGRPKNLDATVVWRIVLFRHDPEQQPKGRHIAVFSVVQQSSGDDLLHGHFYFFAVEGCGWDTPQKFALQQLLW